jgi:D-alanine-D-alanine ligase
MKSNKHIEIVCTTITEFSSMGLDSREGIKTALSKYYDTVGITIINDKDDLSALLDSKPDFVVLGMKFIPKNMALGASDPQKVWISAFLDEHEIPHTGSAQPAHKLELNKHLAKQAVRDAGLQTSDFFVVENSSPATGDHTQHAYPLFIKPTNRGGGMGIDSDSLVYNAEELDAKIHSLSTTLGSDALIESYLPGREFSVAILKKQHTSDYWVMPLELVAEVDTRGARILSAAAKSADTETVLAIEDGVLKTQLCELALDAFRALGARDYGRIDIRLDAEGTPNFLEANLIPSLLNNYGNFPKACMLNLGLDYEAMLIKIVELGIARSKDLPASILHSFSIPYLKQPATPRYKLKSSFKNRTPIVPVVTEI